ncbi:hypothetical protein [Nakamurella aerolata]|uniref:Uncharacterized protein n=1 Tax=Nakamurella aerolata TaxID=1656892 RepID=A0A849A6X2_9ACTN|nr:hypothetical protein [Nakamurella aerolata]NNG34771.1 hypothetical protein [Nakamurella aerolata]
MSSTDTAPVAASESAGPPTLPTVDDFASAVIVDHYDDMINPPGLTNHLAVVQVDHDITAVRSLNVPPVSTGDTITGQLYLDGRLARSYGEPVRCQWRPDRVLRELSAGGCTVQTDTFCPPSEAAVLQRIRVTNHQGRRDVEVALSLDSAVVHAGGGWTEPITKAWSSPLAPSAGNILTRDGVLLLGTPADGSAVSAQWLVTDAAGASPLTAEVPSMTGYRLQLEQGETAELWYGYAIATNRDSAGQSDGKALVRATFERLMTDPAGASRASTDTWNRELAAMFTPDNDEFSGSLPVLHTTNAALRTLYWWGAMGVLWFRRDNPASVLGRSYDTLMPRHWQTTTFIWDYSLSSQVHALLDPAVMRRHLEHWVGLDINKHFGTEWLTGGPVGYWYSVNHYAMTRLVNDYLRYTGDLGFLDAELAAADGDRKALAAHLDDWAHAWQQRRGPSGLADYGGIDNLLECVPSYVHEVASLQGANVWCLRRDADVAEYQARPADAARLRAEADALAALVRGRYVAGEGIFTVGRPDGTVRPVRHCYDFATIGTTMPEDLPTGAAAEMVGFFVRELRTPSWMRALSPRDPDAAYSVRADHQWNGAYPAWPADSARAAIALGHPETVAEWIDGLARTTRQGPPGQAHFVEEAAPTVSGGARKTPPQPPYLIDWACSSAGAWCELVLTGVFGIEVDLDGTVGNSKNVLAAFDPGAKVENLVVQGKTWTVDATGARRN